MSLMRTLLGMAMHPGRIPSSICSFVRTFQVKRARVVALPRVDGGGEQLVVSLTSFGSRLATVHLAIRSMFLQSVKPNKIILYLDAETEVEALPIELLELRDYGLEIRADCENLKGHKKYYYAFKEFPDALVVTIDDDVVYPADTIETLLTAHRAYPLAVVGRRCHEIGFDGNGVLLPYCDWEHECRKSDGGPSFLLMPTGVGSVMYPVGLFDLTLLDEDAIRGCALNGDDLYLKFFEIKNGVGAIYAPNRRNHPYLIPGSQEVSLMQDNVGKNQNDYIMTALMLRYGFEKSDFLRRPEIVMGAE